MMRIFNFALFVALSLLLSCAKPAPEMSGIIVYGHEVRTIRLCGDAQVFWLNVNPDEQRKLLAQSRNLTRYPYQELYIEFSGRWMDEARGEFAKQYAGAVELDKITRLSDQVPESCGTIKIVP